MRILPVISLFSILLILNSCAVTDGIKDGETAFKLKKYTTAATLLKEEYDKENNEVMKGQKAFKIGESYRFANQPEQAEKWYREAVTLGYGQEALLQYALMLKKNEKYQAAIEQFERYIKEEPYTRPEISKEIESCRNAMAWISEGGDYEVKAVSEINSASADFSPALIGTNRLVFSSARQGATGETKDQWTGENFYDIFESSINGFDNFSPPRPLEGFTNTPYNDGIVSFSADGQEMYFTRCGSNDKNINDFCRIYYCYLEPEGGWSPPTPVVLFSDSINYGHPFLTRDGEQLYFSASDPQGYGGSDIFYVKMTLDGWGNPINLGPGVNTEGNEAFPWLDESGTLYFASDGQAGMGGLDIFSVKKIKNKWSELTNLKYPINSNADDFGIIFSNDPSVINADTLEYGFFSSTRSSGKGNDDIYRFIKKKPPLPPARYVLNGIVKEQIYQDPEDPESTILGLQPLVNSLVSIRNETLNRNLSPFVVDSNGSFSIEIDSLTDYRITASNDPGYFASSEEVSTKTKKGEPGSVVEFSVEIVLDKIFEEKEVRLNNIYYDFNEASLREESFPELDLLVELLNDNPSIVIELASHTDSRGSDKYNQELSQRRAESVVNYLLAKGILSERMVAIGYGESKLTNQCADGVECTEEEHQQNRRTTFSVKSDRLNIESEVPENIKVDPAPGEQINNRENE